ncbi:MAG: MATE family efflux transporter [Pseudomonadales bacterium]|nr:MATE family efflux transporter [Pseudomonadales bacterium]
MSHEQPEVTEEVKSTPGIWELAWPAILSNLLFSVIGIVTIKIVGTLGAEAVAAVTTGHRIFWGLQATLMAISAGTTALVARSWGADDPAEAAKVTTVSLWLSNAVAIGLMLPCIFFAYEIASVFGLDENPTRLAAEFIQYLSLFNIAFSINMILGAALRAAGDTKTPLWIGVATNIVNVVLVYLLVHGMYGFPPMGVVGAAIANGVSFAVGGLIFLYLYYSHRMRVGVGGPNSVTRTRVRQLVHIGYPAGVEQFVFQIGFIAFLWLVAFFGTAPYAAYGVGVQILSVSFVVGFGFSIAGSTLVGQHLGAGDSEGAVSSGWRALAMAIGSMVVLSIVIALFANEIARYLINDDEVVRLTVVFIYIMALVQPLMAVEFTLGGCLRGAGDTRFPLMTTMVGLCGVRVGLAAVFVLLGFSVEWIYAALIGDYIVKAVMLLYRFHGGKWQHIFSDSEKKFAQLQS